ncbi:MAG: hypothetical protein AABY18_02975 [Candidatus Thermoplasmatota archaeon]
MHVTSRAVAMLAALSLLVAPVLAAPTTGTQLSSAANTVWIHRNSDDAVYWLSNVKEEPAHNDPDPGYNVAGAVLSNPDGVGYYWSIPLDPAPTGIVQLAPGGTIEATVYLKAITSLPAVGGVPQGAGVGEIEMTLTSGGAALATGESEQVVLEPDTWAEVHWSLTPTAAAFSGDLSWDITFTGASGGAVLGASDDFGWSNVVLPVLGGDVATGPKVAHANLTGPTVEVRHVIDNATNATYHYNWTSAISDPRLTLIGNVTAGSAEVVLDDGAGHDLTLDVANGTMSDDLVGFGQGNWTITLNLTGFQGSVAILVDAAATSPGTTPAGTSTKSGNASGTATTGTAASGNTTGNGTKNGNGKDTPAPAFPLLVGAVAVALAIARRRLR